MLLSSEWYLEKANNAPGSRLRQWFFVIQQKREEKHSRGCLARVYRHHFGLFLLVTCVNTPDCSGFILINIAGGSCSWFLHFRLTTDFLFLSFCLSFFKGSLTFEMSWDQDLNLQMLISSVFTASPLGPWLSPRFRLLSYCGSCCCFLWPGS